MKKQFLLVITLSMAFLFQGCSKEGRALKKFNKSVSSLQKKIENSDKFVSLDGFEYNMKDSDSVKAPYIGTIEFVYTEKVSPEIAKKLVKRDVYAGEIMAKLKSKYGDKKAMSYLVTDKQAANLQKSYEDSGLIRYKYLINLTYGNGKWKIDKAEYVSLSWHKGEAKDSDTKLDAIYDEKTDHECYDKKMKILNDWLNLN